MKIIYSHCMFTKYYPMLPAVLKSFHSIFPSNWEFRLHVDRDEFEHQDWKIIKAWQASGFINITKVNDTVDYTKSMLWRLIPLWDQSVDYVFCRDLDSLPIVKDRQCCVDFINSNLSIHGINDNPAHSIPLMGGMVGFKRQNIADFIKSNLNEFISFIGFQNTDWRIHGKDQDFLNSAFWSRFRHETMIHSSNGMDYGGSYQRRNIPTHIKFNDIPDFISECNTFTNYLGACGPNRDSSIIEKWYDDNNPNDKIKQMNNIKKEIQNV